MIAAVMIRKVRTVSYTFLRNPGYLETLCNLETIISN